LKQYFNHRLLSLDYDFHDILGLLYYVASNLWDASEISKIIVLRRRSKNGSHFVKLENEESHFTGLDCVYTTSFLHQVAQVQEN